jgi:phosphoadenosine phosphosulfate reductase
MQSSDAKAVPVREFDPAELARLDDAPAEEILRWSAQNFEDGEIALSSAFGPGSAVLIHMLADIAPQTPVIFIDTLHHFAETLEHVELVTNRYGLDLRVFKAAPDRETFEAQYGSRLWETDLERYQLLTKVEAFKQATQPLKGWITGRRRDQSSTRTQLPVIEVKEKIRINPLAAWSKKQIWDFILEHKLPYNPLHDRGYASVGDEPLTTPVGAGEHERAGRWRGNEKLECGIHTQIP